MGFKIPSQVHCPVSRYDLVCNAPNGISRAGCMSRKIFLQLNVYEENAV